MLWIQAIGLDYSHHGDQTYALVISLASKTSGETYCAVPTNELRRFDGSPEPSAASGTKNKNPFSIHSYTLLKEVNGFGPNYVYYFIMSQRFTDDGSCLLKWSMSFASYEMLLSHPVRCRGYRELSKNR